MTTLTWKIKYRELKESYKGLSTYKDGTFKVHGLPVSRSLRSHVVRTLGTPLGAAPKAIKKAASKGKYQIKTVVVSPKTAAGSSPTPDVKDAQVVKAVAIAPNKAILKLAHRQYTWAGGKKPVKPSKVAPLPQQASAAKRLNPIPSASAAYSHSPLETRRAGQPSASTVAAHHTPISAVPLTAVALSGPSIDVKAAEPSSLAAPSVVNPLLAAAGRNLRIDPTLNPRDASRVSPLLNPQGDSPAGGEVPSTLNLTPPAAQHSLPTQPMITEEELGADATCCNVLSCNPFALPDLIIGTPCIAYVEAVNFNINEGDCCVAKANANEWKGNLCKFLSTALCVSVAGATFAINRLGGDVQTCHFTTCSKDGCCCEGSVSTPAASPVNAEPARVKPKDNRPRSAANRSRPPTRAESFKGTVTDSSAAADVKVPARPKTAGAERELNGAVDSQLLSPNVERHEPSKSKSKSSHFLFPSPPTTPRAQVKKPAPVDMPILGLSGLNSSNVAGVKDGSQTTRDNRVSNPAVETGATGSILGALAQGSASGAAVSASAAKSARGAFSSRPGTSHHKRVSSTFTVDSATLQDVTNMFRGVRVNGTPNSGAVVGQQVGASPATTKPALPVARR